MPEEPWNVGILIFDQVEVLDFAGPFEVFSRTRVDPSREALRTDQGAPFRPFTVAKTAGPVTATGGLRVLPDYEFADAPRIDLLVVPGGFGTRPLLQDEETLDWIRAIARDARQVTSVCTGSMLLARAGLLEGKRATTHWAAIAELEALGGGVTVERGARWVDDGIISSAGVAAGIDMTFYVVEKLLGKEVADRTARYIDYPRGAAAGGVGAEAI
ncbi:MAG TPA: DJ-1/PfpI family protein [Thermoanaerobaculia bacterium]|nr:DJ-1/PfpI family protein [Thermoanaerobaculia bacterium]